jgi:hypothetical protein
VDHLLLRVKVHGNLQEIIALLHHKQLYI